MNHNTFSRKKAGQKKSTISVKLEHVFENM